MASGSTENAQKFNWQKSNPSSHVFCEIHTVSGKLSNIGKRSINRQHKRSSKYEIAGRMSNRTLSLCAWSGIGSPFAWASVPLMSRICSFLLLNNKTYNPPNVDYLLILDVTLVGYYTHRFSGNAMRNLSESTHSEGLCYTYDLGARYSSFRITMVFENESISGRLLNLRRRSYENVP